jgi:hypothetical protein
MRRLAEVNDLEKLRSSFYLFVFGGVMGAQAPIEGGSGKAVGFAARGKAFPPLFIQKTFPVGNYSMVWNVRKRSFS